MPRRSGCHWEAESLRWLALVSFRLCGQLVSQGCGRADFRGGGDLPQLSLRGLTEGKDVAIYIKQCNKRNRLPQSLCSFAMTGGGDSPSA